MWVPTAHGDQRQHWIDPRGLELQIIVNFCVVLGIEPKSSVRAAPFTEPPLQLQPSC